MQYAVRVQYFLLVGVHLTSFTVNPYTHVSLSVFGHQDNPLHLKKWPKIVVISYKMLHHLRNSMLEHVWACLIVDESHHLRCSKKASEPEEVQDLIFGKK